MSTVKKRGCSNDPNIFCYICGSFTLSSQRREITNFVKNLYFAYFKVKLGDQDKSWAPHKVCKSCVESLRYWSQGKDRHLKFGIPMIWREQKNHVDDCYFCLVNVKGYNKRNKHKLQYPNLASALRPIPQSEEIPVPTFTELSEIDDEELGLFFDSSQTDENSELDFQLSSSFSERPLLFNQSELNDLVRDLNLSKHASELLASRLQEKNLLQPGSSVTFYRNREKLFLNYFSLKSSLVYCHDIEGLLLQLGITQYQLNEWRLFIDSSKRSLKCVLLHNGNRYASIPVGHSVTLKESYENVKNVLETLKYNDHGWMICVDLKMMNFFLGQQGGYTKYPCFLCYWDSRAKDEHWIRDQWPARSSLAPGDKNIIHRPLVHAKIILPPLHIKLGVMKQYVKALDHSGDCFRYICQTFPGLSEEKKKAGVFNGPQIRQLLRDSNFIASMTAHEARAWNAFSLAVNNFFGNRKAENYEDLVKELLASMQEMQCSMSIKLHFLKSHLDYFPENLGNISEEQGERFHQDIKVMEERYQGRWDCHMMVDYCWNLKRESSTAVHKRKSL